MAIAFLEVAIHNILFVRRVYPEAIFERRRCFGVAVWMARFPSLVESISAALRNAMAPMLAGVVEAVVLVITDAESEAAIEQYVFRTSLSGGYVPVAAASSVASLSAAASHAAAGRGAAAGRPPPGGGPGLVYVPEVPATYSDFETMCAAALLRIGMLEVQLPPLPRPFMIAAPGGGEEARGGAAFTILLRTHEVLRGPNDRRDYATAIAGSGGAGAGAAPAGVPAWTPGLLGSASDAPGSSSSSVAGGPSLVGSTSSGQPFWIRVDPGDAEESITTAAAAAAVAARTAAAASGAGSSGAGAAAGAGVGTSAASSAGGLGGAHHMPPVVTKPIKSIRAGSLALDVSLEMPTLTGSVASVAAGAPR